MKRGSDLLFFYLLIQTVAGEHPGLVITSCDACDEHASCQTVVYPEGLTSSFNSLTCVCDDGFYGNGLTCSPGPLAPSGVEHVPHISSRRRRAAVPPNNLTHVLFNCSFSQCPDGQDCLNSTGVNQSCADPCSNYQVLDDAWRSTSAHVYTVGVHCDYWVKWEGWYRMMLGNTSAFMPDKCVDWLMCGTHGPMWLNSEHPKLTDQIIQSTVCAVWKGSCCYAETKPIHVKACPGNYYVYKLQRPPGCNIAYCAAVNASQPTTTTAPEKTTTTTEAPDTTPKNVTHVLFNCGFSQCPDGQDCLNSNGVNQSCADPCSNYQVLDDAWRSTSYKFKNSSGLHCDVSVEMKGWYRMMLGNTSASMPDKCVDELMCGTHAPMWLNSKHPKLTDQVIQSTACAAWSGSCCNWETKPIHVKACPGNYYVYKLKSPPTCYLAYCTTVNGSQPTTTEAPETTTKNPLPPDHPALPEPVLRCGESVMEVGLQVAKLQAIGLDAFSAHLSDPRCHDHAEINSTVWYRVERTETTCGNTLKTNGTHALYSNSLFVYPVLNVSFVRPLSVPFTCAYPLDGHSSLNIAVRPYLPVDNAAVGMGTAVRATMSLFQNANYTDPYPAGPITKDVGSVLYVGVSIDEPESKRFVVVLEECHASHSSSPEDLKRYYLIQKRCPTEERFVKLNESGSSLQARFSALLFLYQGDYQDVFLHCSFSLCDQRSSSCSPVCSRRRSRSAFKSNPLKPLTIGPITWGKKLG